MKTRFENIKVSKEEYMYFVSMSRQQRLQYFFELYNQPNVDYTITAVDLSSFFSSIHTELEKSTEADKITPPENSIDMSNVDRVDVMIDDEIIMIEANSLRALRTVKDRFMEAGYILQRDIEQEKMFRKDKITRYMRVFYIVDQITGICFN
jgi:hypothetical protein